MSSDTKKWLKLLFVITMAAQILSSVFVALAVSGFMVVALTVIPVGLLGVVFFAITGGRSA